MTRDEIDEMAAGYLECALFTADEELIPPKSGEFDASPYIDRFPKSVKLAAAEVCAKFYDDNADDLADYPPRAAGHDLWYTRNHHGCGFWEADHCEDEQGQRLTTKAHMIGERHVFRHGRWFIIE